MSTCAIQKLSPQQRSFYFNLGINWQVGKWTEVDVCEASMYRMKEALLGNSNNKMNRAQSWETARNLSNLLLLVAVLGLCGTGRASFSVGTGSVAMALAFSSCSAQAQWPYGTRDLSSSTRDQTHVRCIGRQMLNHWITREVPSNYSVISQIKMIQQSK